MSESKPRVAVILAGCGYLDGAAIQEAVLTLLYLDQAGAVVTCAAPNIDQAHVVNHLTGEVAEGETRNVLVESARIARGKIVEVSELKAEDFDALVLPGGFGAAKNLSDYAFKGPEMEVESSVASFVKAMHAADKPIGFVCITPVIAAKVLGGEGRPALTIGVDETTAGHIQQLGAGHEKCATESFVVDSERKIVSTPAYMSGAWTADVAAGIEKLVAETLKLAAG